MDPIHAGLTMSDLRGEPEAQHIEGENPKPGIKGSDIVDSISLRSVINQAVEPHLFFTLEGQLLDMNPAGCLYFGVDREALTGLNIYDLLILEDAAVLKEVLTGIHESGAGVIELHFRAKGVGLLTTEVAYQLIESVDGEVVYARVRDMQVVRILHQLLEQRETSFKGAERLAKLGSWEFYPREGKIDWSDETFNIFGLPITAKAPTFEDYMHKVHPDDVEYLGQIVQNAIENGEDYFVKHRIIRPDGEVRWVYGRGDVQINGDGHIEKVYGTVQDITEEESIREEMRKSEQRLRFHVDRSPLAYVEWNTEFEIVEWNEAAEKIFGFSKQEALAGQANIIPEDEADAINQVVSDLLSDEGGTHSINTNLTKSGKRITVEWFNTTLKGENDEIIGIGSIVQDITERIEAKRQLEGYAHDLEIAKEKAESAARAKSEFLANMSHEIRTPMNGVIGMASLLLDTDLDEEQQDYVETIVQSGESLLSIINDILNLSKIEAGKIELEYMPFDIRDLLENTCDLLAAKAAEKQLELILFFSPDVPASVIGDPTRVQQVLLNLMGNAIKFTHTGHVEVRLETKEVLDDSFRLAFHVSDTGIGISQDKQNKLFDAFTQVDASISRKYGGTGLGLKISAELAHLMQGRISVESTEGVGSTFSFDLVVKNGESQNMCTYDLDGMHVLLAEPNESVRQMIGTFLDELNCTWASVTSIDEISRVLNIDNEVEVLLLASSFWNEPIIELVDHVGEVGGTIPAIIVLSSIIDRTEYKGARERLAKPVHLKSLYRSLKKVGILQE